MLVRVVRDNLDYGVYQFMKGKKLIVMDVIVHTIGKIEERRCIGEEMGKHTIYNIPTGMIRKYNSLKE
jgi:hypothetical protein